MKVLSLEKTKKIEVFFGFLLVYSYLCTRFPRNRWQEVTSCLLCCAWNDTAKLYN